MLFEFSRPPRRRAYCSDGKEKPLYTTFTGMELVMLSKGRLPSVISGFHKYVTEPRRLLRIAPSMRPKAYSPLICRLYVSGAWTTPLVTRGNGTKLPDAKFALLIELMKFETRVTREIWGE